MSRNPPHQWLLVIQPQAKKMFDMLSSGHKQGVFRRLQDLLNADNPYGLTFVEMLKEKKFEQIRKFRVGDYRIFFVIETKAIEDTGHLYKGTLFLLDIRDRKDAY